MQDLQAVGAPGLIRHWLEQRPEGRKVPEIDLAFWLIKILTTAMGEVTSDYLVHQFDPVLVVPIAGLGLLVATRQRH